MKTIRTYDNLGEAGFAQSLLEASGIDAALLDQNVGASGEAFVMGGMRLQVPEEDFDRAVEILENRIPDSEEVAPDAPVVPEHEVPQTHDQATAEAKE
jgi:hypothetical protein